MLTSPSPKQPAAPAQDMGLPPAPTPAPQPEATPDNSMFIEQLDNHLNGLPPEAQKIFEDGFKEYDKLPEVLGTLMPDAYEYFKTIQTALSQQDSQAAGQSQPATEQAAASPEASATNAQSPLLGSAQPSAKATSGSVSLNPSS